MQYANRAGQPLFHVEHTGGAERRGLRGACQQAGAVAVLRGTHRRGGAPGSAWSRRRDGAAGFARTVQAGLGSGSFTRNRPPGGARGVRGRSGNRGTRSPGGGVWFHVEHADKGNAGCFTWNAQTKRGAGCRGRSGTLVSAASVVWHTPSRRGSGTSREAYDEAQQGSMGEAREPWGGTWTLRPVRGTPPAGWAPRSSGSLQRGDTHGN